MCVTRSRTYIRARKHIYLIFTLFLLTSVEVYSDRTVVCHLFTFCLLYTSTSSNCETKSNKNTKFWGIKEYCT